MRQPLPAKVAHRELSPPGRLDYKVPEDASKTAVLIAIHPFEDEHHILLIRRVSKASDRHSGQISLPGGRLEPADQSLLNCALREAEEEVALATESFRALGQLTPLYIPVSGYHVFPFIGVFEQQEYLVAQDSEVAEIYRIPLREFLQEDMIQQADHEVRPNLILPDVLHFDIHGLFVWGATAMILNEFRWVLREAAQDIQ